LLYVYVPTGEQFNGSEGLIVALGFRVITILIAFIGAAYYLMGRREVSQVWSEAQQTEAASDDEHVLISSVEGALT
jgi:hypothetical protein